MLKTSCVKQTLLMNKHTLWVGRWVLLSSFALPFSPGPQQSAKPVQCLWMADKIKGQADVHPDLGPLHNAVLSWRHLIWSARSFSCVSLQQSQICYF